MLTSKEILDILDKHFEENQNHLRKEIDNLIWNGGYTMKSLDKSIKDQFPSKATPAKWEIEYWNHELTYTHDGMKIFSCGINSRRDWPNEANASLIAAAPELIDRLKDTNSALINWKRIIESKESGITKTEETIAYNCGLIIAENAKIIKQAEWRE